MRAVQLFALSLKWSKGLQNTMYVLPPACRQSWKIHVALTDEVTGQNIYYKLDGA